MLHTACSRNRARQLYNCKMIENFKQFYFLSDILFKSVKHPSSVSMSQDRETAEKLCIENRGCFGCLSVLPAFAIKANVEIVEMDCFTQRSAEFLILNVDLGIMDLFGFYQISNIITSSAVSLIL
jgi:hypothetical protein